MNTEKKTVGISKRNTQGSLDGVISTKRHSINNIITPDIKLL